MPTSLAAGSWPSLESFVAEKTTRCGFCDAKDYRLCDCPLHICFPNWPPELQTDLRARDWQRDPGGRTERSHNAPEGWTPEWVGY